MSPGPPRRIGALESLRGLAAAVVVVRHAFNALATSIPLQRAVVESPLAVLLNAQGAVQLFFVLSGYVLAGSLARGHSGVDVVQFLTKRVFRIHPPYLAGLGLAWLASFAYTVPGPGHATSPWIGLYARVHLDLGQLVASLGFPGSAFHQLPVGWTLRVEMIYSLLLPVLFLLAVRTHWGLLLAGCAAALVWGEGQAPRYALDFGLGIAAHLERERLGRWLGGAPRAAPAAVLAGSLALFCAPVWLGWSRPALGVLAGGFDRASVAVSGIGALGLVVCGAQVAGVQRALSAAPLLFLGRISYSLYLTHFTVLLLAVPALREPLTAAKGSALVLGVLGVSILVSVPLHRFVERPAILVGNRICAAIAARAHVRALDASLPGR